MSNYFEGKLNDIVGRLACGESIASERLARESVKIVYQLSPDFEKVPEQYRKSFEKLIDCCKRTIEGTEGRTPVRMKGMENKTAASNIRMLYEILHQC